MKKEPLPGKSHDSSGAGGRRGAGGGGGDARLLRPLPRSGAWGLTAYFHPYRCPLPQSQLRGSRLQMGKRRLKEREAAWLAMPGLASNRLFPRGLWGFRGGPAEAPQEGGRGGRSPRHFHQLEGATRFCARCPVSRWHAQTQEPLALPGPSLAEDLKAECGNPSRPPGPRASVLWLYRVRTLRQARGCLKRPPAPPPGAPPAPMHLLQGWGWKPPPACWMQGKGASAARGVGTGTHRRNGGPQRTQTRPEPVCSR